MFKTIKTPDDDIRTIMNRHTISDLLLRKAERSNKD